LHAATLLYAPVFVPRLMLGTCYSVGAHAIKTKGFAFASFSCKTSDMSWKKLWIRMGPFRVVQSASSRFLFDSGTITGCSFSTTRQFYPVRLSEMDDFLHPQGFHKINLDHSCHEIVYGKELNPKLVL
jgi:hypothetical protein